MREDLILDALVNIFIRQRSSDLVPVQVSLVEKDRGEPFVSGEAIVHPSPNNIDTINIQHRASRAKYNEKKPKCTIGNSVSKGS